MNSPQAPVQAHAHAQDQDQNQIHGQALQVPDQAADAEGQPSTVTALVLLSAATPATALDTAVAESVLNPPATTRQAGQVNKGLLLLHLQLRHVALATVTYEGGGDEGNTNGVYLFMADSQAQGDTEAVHAELLTHVPFWVVDEQLSHRQGHGLVFKLSQTGLEKALDETAWELVTDLHGGFFNGDGGAGEVRFHAAAQTVVIAHNDHYTASNFSETLV